MNQWSASEFLQRSLYIENHPLRQESQEYKERYCRALLYFVQKYRASDTVAISFAEAYSQALIGKNSFTININTVNKSEIVGTLKKIVKFKKKSYKRIRLRYFFMIDCVYICAFNDRNIALSIISELKSLSNGCYRKKYESIFSSLYDGTPLSKKMEYLHDYVSFWILQHRFDKAPLKTFLVTATMSAGKSTLINALIGKPLAKSAQDACTGQLCWLYNKPFNDHLTNLFTDTVHCDKTQKEIYAAEVDQECTISTYFNSPINLTKRICIIDSPGTNSAINPHHSEISKNCISSETYDRLIYVFSADHLGTDEELTYLKYILDNVPHDKIIFILNKVDLFQSEEDSIEQSIQNIENDLEKAGYSGKAEVFPLSSYFALLINKKISEKELTFKEQIDFDFLSAIFCTPEYDLSCYYPLINKSWTEASRNCLAARCGLYGISTELFGE